MTAAELWRQYHLARSRSKTAVSRLWTATGTFDTRYAGIDPVASSAFAGAAEGLLREVLKAAIELVDAIRAFGPERTGYAEENGEPNEFIFYTLDLLERLQELVPKKKMRELLAKLDAVTTDAGATPDEADNAKRRATVLRAKLDQSEEAT